MATEEEDAKPAKRGDNPVYILGFAAVVCVVSSLLLSTVAVSLGPRQKANEEDYRKRNVLKAFGIAIVEDGAKLPAAEIDAIFAEHIDEIYLDPESGEVIDEVPQGRARKKALQEKSILPLYRWYANVEKMEETEAEAYAFPISGKGLWSTVVGYLGLEGDLATIKAITFYKHGETPGLGAEVDKEWFQRQFEGKTLWTPEAGVVDFKIAKGKNAADLVDDPHAVGGITAATITSDGVQDFLVEDMKRYEPFFEKVRRADDPDPASKSDTESGTGPD